MGHFAVIAVAIPLFGAGAIALASCFAFDLLAGKANRTGPSTFRRIALTASVLTFVVMLCSTVVDLVLGPRGPEGLGGVFALLTAAVWLPVVFVGRQCDVKRPGLLYALLLLLEASFLGVFFAADAVWFCVCLEASTLVLYLLIGGWGGRESEPIARKFLLFNLAADMLVLIALLGVVIAAGRMSEGSETRSNHELSYSLSALTRDVPRLAFDDIGGQEYWKHARRWLLTVLVLGLAIKTPLLPFHTWFAPAVAEGPLCAGLAMLGSGLWVGTYAFVRLVGPLGGDLGAWGEVLVAVVVLGALHESLLTLAHGDLKKMTASAGLSQASLAVAGFFSQQTTGVIGAVLLAISGGLAFTLMMFTFGFLEMRFGARDLTNVGGIWRRMPQLSSALVLAVLALVGIPGLSGFPALFPILGALFGFEWLSGLVAMIAGLIVAWALFWMLERVVFSPSPSVVGASVGTDGVGGAASFESAGPERTGDLRRSEVLFVAPLIAGIVLLGLRPQAVVDFVSASLRMIFFSP
ncbi:MAG TPA: proton-conducting transporter membrane subunit [Planctomycetaceae bacterium]|nr:proton-conducting transporter membrane subunit [Planctomycetaceae bacterium]